MPSPPQVRILEKEANARGDLFGRLMEGLFLALGYEKVRLNIHKSGREIDLSAEHRTENRRVVAECKATGSAIGGDDVNKFVGSLDAETRKQPGVQTVGYFISLSGFTETAIEQELDLGGKRVVLLDACQVVKELTTGHIVVSEDKAVELAGRCATTPGIKFVLESQRELLAHEIGWIWAIYFSQNKQLTHFSLVHADGNFIAPALAQAIVISDEAVGGPLCRLHYLKPPADPVASEESINNAREKYLRFLERECGEIQLQGLPADQEVGARRLRLENIFVPLHVVKSVTAAEESPPEGKKQSQGQSRGAHPKAKRGRISRKEDGERLSVGQVLGLFSRVAILGLPGGGKSTLLKRLATAYGFPERRLLIDDKLPDRKWLPLFVRCRQLGPLVRSPIIEILEAIPDRAEMSSDAGEGFKLVVSRALREGAALLLLDGLDEISSEGDRACFVHQLRTFLATYPKVALVVTSREAGFRVIGGALSTECQHFKLDDFDQDDIKALSLSWHKEVVGDSSQIRSDAEKLADTISSNDRLLQLAANPLLLTTLLLVKRWVGQLPTRRTVLYAKAIEVLLMTWNVEGHEPLDQDEAIPQLEYLAFTMMEAGLQSISHKRLREVLTDARTEMPEVLGCARMSVSEFIQRVELRSSLLMLSGHVEEDGAIYQTYEFRHLTFQEYLVASAIVDGHYPNRKEEDDLIGILGPHLRHEQWSEVVPLTAVLAGRKVQPLIRHLIQLSDKWPRSRRQSEVKPNSPAELLAACLSDEIQAPPELLKEAMRRVIHASSFFTPSGRIGITKYGNMLYEVACDEFRKSNTDVMKVGGNLVEMFQAQIGIEDRFPLTDVMARSVDKMLHATDSMENAIACLIIMKQAYYATGQKEHWEWLGLNPSDKGSADPFAPQKLHEWRGGVRLLMGTADLYLKCSVLWALAWLAQSTTWEPRDVAELVPDLVSLWRTTKSEDLLHLVPWLISALPVFDKGDVAITPGSADLGGFLANRYRQLTATDHEGGILVAAYYFGVPWSDGELSKLASSHKGEPPHVNKWAVELLSFLGERSSLSAN